MTLLYQAAIQLQNSSTSVVSDVVSDVLRYVTPSRIVIAKRRAPNVFELRFICRNVERRPAIFVAPSDTRDDLAPALWASLQHCLPVLAHARQELSVVVPGFFQELEEKRWRGSPAGVR